MMLVIILIICNGSNVLFQESMTFLKHAISSDWIQSHGLKYLFAALHNVGIVLYRNNKMEEVSLQYDYY